MGSRNVIVTIQVSDSNPEKCGLACPFRRGMYCDLWILAGEPREECRIGVGFRCDVCKRGEEQNQ